MSQSKSISNTDPSLSNTIPTAFDSIITDTLEKVTRINGVDQQTNALIRGIAKKLEFVSESGNLNEDNPVVSSYIQIKNTTMNPKLLKGDFRFLTNSLLYKSSSSDDSTTIKELSTLSGLSEEWIERNISLFEKCDIVTSSKTIIRINSENSNLEKLQTFRNALCDYEETIGEIIDIKTPESNKDELY